MAGLCPVLAGLPDRWALRPVLTAPAVPALSAGPAPRWTQGPAWSPGHTAPRWQWEL